MPRPKNKSELIELSSSNYMKLLTFVDSLHDDEQHVTFPEGMMNRKIGDVLAHLHHWHLMMLDWHTVGMSGEKPDMPAKGYTWKTTPQLNQWIWEKYANIHLADIKIQLQQSFESLQCLIQEHSNKELFEKKRYKWTGTTSLGSYLVSATSSHYDWALKLIKKARKELS